MSELKETGHTPELTAEHDGREVPVKRPTAANWKPPFQKSDRLVDRQTGVLQTRQEVHSETFTSHHTSSYCCSQSSCSPVETRRRVHAIISQSQLPAPEPWATPPPSVIGQSFSEIQRREEQAESKSCGLNTNTPHDAVAGGMLEAELQQQEVMTEDSLSSDEYECTSPDDISLPPLSETPESNLVQSDVEDSFCFNSHSIHSHRCHAHSETSGAANANANAVIQQQTETRASPPADPHRSARFRSEFISVIQSPPSIPTPRLSSSTLSRTRETRETSPTLSCPEPKPVHNNSPDIHQHNRPQSDAVLQNMTETPPQTDPKTSNSAPQKTFLQNTGFLKSSPQTVTCQHQSFPQLLPESCFSLHQDLNPVQTSKKTPVVSKPQSSFTISQQITSCWYVSSDGHDASLQASRLISQEDRPLTKNTTAESDIVPQTDLFPQRDNLTQRSSCPRQAVTTPDSACHEDNNLPPDTGKSSSTFRQTSTLEDHSLPRSFSVSPSETTETLSVPKPTTNSLTTSTFSHQALISDCCAMQQALSLSPLSQASPALHQVTSPVTPEPISISGDRVCPLQEPLSSSCTQQCMHDPGVTPSCPVQSCDPPQDLPDTQAHAASAWLANPHAAPPSPPPHLLTPDQDPDICWPMAIREEITLTPQIQGPPVPPPPPLPQAHSESHPREKTCEATPRCFTRPLSHAAMMGGSPVTLEVEVTGHPEPTLTWWVAYNQLHNNT
ncbi:hypothetical protein LDENG_00184120 [Lucifuga dentata]|nr:hypothetical protein LDENG_00184120 [Lucifuga dentata]